MHSYTEITIKINVIKLLTKSNKRLCHANSFYEINSLQEYINCSTDYNNIFTT